MLHKAVKQSMPFKTIHLKGPIWKASPEVRELLSDCKQTYKLWAQSGEIDEKLKKRQYSGETNFEKTIEKGNI